MSIRNLALANELAKALLPTSHSQMVQDPQAFSNGSFQRTLDKILTCVSAHNKTNFTDVSAFNELIGNTRGAADLHQVRKQLDLITSEFKELSDAIAQLENASEWVAVVSEEQELIVATEARDKAVIEIRDGIADVLVTTYGLAHRMGIDADKDMLAVSTSNASKFFTGTDGDAAQVCKALVDSLGIAVEVRQAADLQQTTEDGEAFCVWAFISADDSDPERPRGKLLKAPGYKPPVFD